MANTESAPGPFGDTPGAQSEESTLGREGVRMSRTWSAIGIVSTGVLIAYGLSSSVRTDLASLMVMYSLLGLALYIPFRFTEQISLAYAGYLGIGAYSFGLGSNHADGAVGLIAGIILASIIGLLVALATRRLSGYFVAVATMLVGLVLLRFFISSSGVTGGPTGLSFAREIGGLTVTREMALVAGAILFAALALTVERFGKSRIGRGLILMGEHEDAAESLGLSPMLYKSTALTLGAGLAALAGALLALGRGFVLPDSFGLGVAFFALFVPIIGGMGSAWGCLAGAVVIVYVQDAAGDFGPARLMFGIGVLIVVLLFRGGMLGGLALLGRKIWRAAEIGDSTGSNDGRRAIPEIPEESSGMGPNGTEYAARNGSQTSTPIGGGSRVVLEVAGVTKQFGGIIALSDVSFSVLAGQIMAVVGPNGAGKSTLVDVVTGHQLPESGRVIFDGIEVNELSPSRRARGGMSRTFQHPKLAGHLSVGSNVEIGLLRSLVPDTLLGQTRQLGAGALSHSPSDEASVQELCSRLGILEIEEQVADASYGIEKLVEIGRALISNPPLLLLDEPFAGLFGEEIERISKVLALLRTQGVAIVLIDHNIDVVRKVADHMIVLSQGEVIAEGIPDQALSVPAVREAYFGEPIHD